MTASNEDDFIDVEGDENLLHQYAQQQQQLEQQEMDPSQLVTEAGEERNFAQVFEQIDPNAVDPLGVGGIAEGGGYTAAGMEEFEFAGGEFDEEGNFDSELFFFVMLPRLFELKYWFNIMNIRK